jgi:hypothetical protein
LCPSSDPCGNHQVNRIPEAFAWPQPFKVTPGTRILTTEAAKEWAELAHDIKAPVSGGSGDAADDSVINDVLRQRIAELEGETLRLKAEISELRGPDADEEEEEDETEGYRVAWLSRADAAVELARMSTERLSRVLVDDVAMRLTRAAVKAWAELADKVEQQHKRDAPLLAKKAAERKKRFAASRRHRGGAKPQSNLR